MNDKFRMFLESVDTGNQSFVLELNDSFEKNNCKCEIKTAKSGYLVSYVLGDTKKTLANFVFRKSGIKIRIYAEHIGEYEELLDTLPEKMKKEIKKASVCKRLVNPDDCNPNCVMGYTFYMDGEEYKKCRYMAFMPALSEENNPYIRQLIEKELECSGGVSQDSPK